VRVILRPLRRQNAWLLRKAEGIPKALIPSYQKGTYPKGSARIVNNALQRMWQTCRKTKQIPLDKQISSIVKKNKVLFLKVQTELIPFRVKEVNDMDELLLGHYNSAVVWLKGNKWVADVQVEVEGKYVDGLPEAVVGIDLGKKHNCYSVWVNNKEIYRGFDSYGEYHRTFMKITDDISVLQCNFKGTRKELSKALNPLYERRRQLLRQYYGTLRNKILSHIPEGFNPVFVVEDLEYLPRAELTKKQRAWASAELANGVFANGIEWNGYKLVKVDPRGTTHTCWNCGQKVKSRNDRKVTCVTCFPLGLDRDLNGARNIARRYMLSRMGERTCTSIVSSMTFMNQV